MKKLLLLAVLIAGCDQMKKNDSLEAVKYNRAQDSLAQIRKDSAEMYWKAVTIGSYLDQVMQQARLDSLTLYKANKSVHISKK